MKECDFMAMITCPNCGEQVSEKAKKVCVLQNGTDTGRKEVRRELKNMQIISN